LSGSRITLDQDNLVRQKTDPSDQKSLSTPIYLLF
jgi:hypothetical protein